MSVEDILTRPQPPFDERVNYGADPSQFLQVRLPRTPPPHPALLNLHGGYWRAKYDLAHAGHVCQALRAAGIATFNAEYRRLGNPGGGWPGTFEDVRSAYRFLLQSRSRFHLHPDRFVAIGHSAGGQLALCLAAHEPTLRRVVSLAGVVDLKQACALHLSHDAVAEFLGGNPDAVPDHYREADPLELSLPHARQWLFHGDADDTVPPQFSRDYATRKKKAGESVDLTALRGVGHFDWIDPASDAFAHVKRTLLVMLGLK